MSELGINTSTSKSIADFLDSFQIRSFSYQTDGEASADDEITVAKSIFDEIVEETENDVRDEQNKESDANVDHDKAVV